MELQQALLISLLVNISMATIEEDLILILKSCNWKQYVDDAHAYVKPTKEKFILNKLNNYHPHINFTFKLEKNNETNEFMSVTKGFLKVLRKS